MRTANPLLTHLSDVSTLPSAPKPAWSARISERFQLLLAADVADWFDSELWRSQGGGEYRWGVDPQVLLGKAPETIWPALMPPDLLPILGNGAGDWLCLQVDENSRASRIVQWYHGGGDWIPWGRSLAEAILFDALCDRIPGPQRGHAVSPEPSARVPRDSQDRFLRWATAHVPVEVAELPWREAERADVASVLLDAGVAEEAVRCELVQAALSEPLSSVLDPVASKGIHQEWNQVVEWMFDMRRMPASIRQAWGDLFQIDLECEQDWDTVHAHCGRVIETAPELTWAWDLYGYGCHRRGQQSEALQAYHAGSQRSVFTDQSIRLRTHWSGQWAAKFSAAMLRDLSPESIESSEYLQILCMDDSVDRRDRAMKYWRERSIRCLESGEPSAAYAAAVAAGWDLGAPSMSDYAEVLERVGKTAEAAGFAARAELAATHFACLQTRYGV